MGQTTLYGDFETCDLLLTSHGCIGNVVGGFTSPDSEVGIGGISKTNDRTGNMEKSKVLYINEIVSCYQIIVIYKYI